MKRFIGQLMINRIVIKRDHDRVLGPPVQDSGHLASTPQTTVCTCTFVGTLLTCQLESSCHLSTPLLPATSTVS